MANSAAKVTTIATHIVHSEHQISLQDPFVLGPFDQLGHFATPVNAVWIYKSSSSIDLIPMNRLQKAVSRLLDYYPHLTGRLHIDPDTDTRTVTNLGEGIHLYDAYCDAPLQLFSKRSSTSDHEFSIFDFPRIGNDLVGPWDMSRDGAQRNPVFTIQRTKFSCCAVAIGMTLSHVIGGAGTFLGIYQDLAELYRAIDPSIKEPIELTSPPYITPFMVSQMLQMGIDKKRQALANIPSGYSLMAYDGLAQPDSKFESHTQEDLNKDPYVGRSLRFSASAVQALKRQAVEPDNIDAQVSAFTALTAHLWQRTLLARLEGAKLRSIEKTQAFSFSTYGTSVNFVPHFGLPERSVGNTVVTPVITLDSKKLVQAPLWEIAKIINSQVRHVSEDETRNLGSWIAVQPKKSLISLNFKPSPTSFITTGWHKFPLYSGAELDVPPTFASPIPMDALADGMVLFFEPKLKDGGLEAIVMLKSSTWDYLDSDEEFITAWDKAM